MKRHLKKLVSLFLSVVLLICISSSALLAVGAAGDSQENATPYTFGESVVGSISSQNIRDFYSLDLQSSGRITVYAAANIQKSNYYLYDENGNKLWESTYRYWDDSTEMMVLNVTFDLTKGKYCFVVECCDKKYGSYTMKTDFTSAEETFGEVSGGINNSYITSNEIAFDTVYTGQIAKNDEKDFYKLTLPTSGNLTIDVTANIQKSTFRLYDENFQEVWAAAYKFWNEDSEILKINDTISLTSGTYYFLVERYDATGNYSFSTSFESANESFIEKAGGSDNKFAQANEIELDNEYKGQIAINDDKDFYVFTLTEKTKINIDIAAHIYKASFYMYDSDFNTVWDAKYKFWDQSNETILINESTELAAGTYYFMVEKYESMGNYSFNLSKNSSGSPSTGSRILGDVDGDNVVKIKDATAIQKYLADIDTGLGIGSEI